MSSVQTSILPGGIVLLQLSGDLTSDKRAEIEQGIAQARALITEQVSLMGGKVPCLLDLSAFTGKYDQDIVNLFAAFAAENKETISKTAGFGGNLNASLVTAAVGMLADRDNIEVFGSREEAEAALRTV